MTVLRLSPVSPEEAMRLSHGDSSDMSPAAIENRMRKFAQLYRLWKVTRDARIAAGKPGPFDLPPPGFRRVSR